MKIIEQGLGEFGTRNMGIYAEEVNLGRAVPDLIDGLKPVQRRIMWAASLLGKDFVKTARIIGEVIGKYHPHGDIGVNGAITTIVQSNVSTISGRGNWGSLIDAAAAARYCVVGDTRIVTDRGSIKIKDLASSPDYLKVSGHKEKLKVQVATHDGVGSTAFWLNSGFHKTLKVSTSLGYNVSCTPNHPFLVPGKSLKHEWKTAEQLSPGDWVCLNRNTSTIEQVAGGARLAFKPSSDPRRNNSPTSFPKKMSVDLAWLLGAITSDGQFSKKGVYFNNTDFDFFDKFVSVWTYLFPGLHYTSAKYPPRGYGRKHFKAFWCASLTIMDFFKSLGVVTGNSYSLVVPEVIFRSSQEECGAFLQAYFEGDGSISQKAKSFQYGIGCCSVNYDLLTQIKALLLSHFGIVSNSICLSQEHEVSKQARATTKGKLYSFRFSGTENILRFDRHIGFFSARKLAILKRAVRHRTNITKYSNPGSLVLHERFPPSFAKTLGKWTSNSTYADGPSWRPLLRKFSSKEHFVHTLKAQYDSIKASIDFRRTVLNRLTDIMEKDYVYVQVTGIAEGEKQFVYDLTVQEKHSFTANGLIVHNTNCCLSNYGWTFFNPDYISRSVTSFVPNYDDTLQEPVSLPALLPNVLLNGGEGIGVGTTTMLPTFTPESVALVISRLLKGETLHPIDYAKTLKYANKWGGKLVNTKENRQAWVSMFKSPAASVQFESSLVVDKDNKSIEISDWPQGLNPLKVIERVRAFPETDQAFNHAGALGFRIEMRKDHNYAQFDKFVEHVRQATRVRRAFKLNVTHRKSSVVDGVVSFDTKYLSLSVPELINAWLKERLALEKRSLAFRIEKQNLAIAYSKLLIFAANNADAIIKVIRTSMDPLKSLMTKFKFSTLQANQILDLQLRKLSKLDQEQLKVKLQEQEVALKQLQQWLKAPKAKIVNDIAEVMKAIDKDRKFEFDKDRKMKVA